MPLLHDFAKTLEAHGQYRAAYPAGLLMTRYFLRELLSRAAEHGCLTAIEQRGAHVYATVYKRQRVES